MIDNQTINKILVSVVLPAFNRAETIENALDSIKGQSHRPLEIIVVNDGSEDTTEKIVKKWESAHATNSSLILRYTEQANQGANAARNKGIEKASGEFVAFLDSDDKWLPQKLTKQISIFRNNQQVGGVYCGMRNVDLESGEKETFSPRSYPSGKILRELLIHDVTEATSSWIVRKKCFAKTGLFDTSLPARQDWDMWIRLAAHYEIGCVPEVLVELGNHEGARVRSDPYREISAHKTIYDKYKYLREQYPFWVSLAAKSAMYRRRGRVYFHRGISVPKAMAMQTLAILTWPFNFDSYAALCGMFLSKNARKYLRFIWNRLFGKTLLAIKTH